MQKKVIDIFPPKEAKKDFQLLVEEKIKEEKKIPRDGKKKVSRLRIGLLFLFLFLISGSIFLHFVLAKVNVEISPETENFSLEKEITVDSKTNQIVLSQALVPGKIFEVEKSASQQFSCSGQVVKEKNAQGTIRVYNNSGNSQTLVTNTRFQPPLEKVLYFRSTKPIVIPAKSYTDVEVKADRPGEEYNIGPTTFSVPGLAGLPQYYNIYGKSFSAMTGGFKGLVSQVKQEDLNSAKENLLEKLAKETKDYLNSESPDFIFLKEAMSQEIIEASSSVPVGTEVETFDFNERIKTRVLAFKKSDLDNFVKEFIKLQIQNTGKKLEEQGLKIDYSVADAKAPLEKITISVKISATIYSDIDQEALKKALLGKSIKQSRVLLENQPGINSSELNVFPFWLGKIPDDKDKVELKLNIIP